MVIPTMSIFGRWRWLSRNKRRLKPGGASGASDLDRRLVFGIMPRRWPSWKQFKHLGRFLSPQERRVVAAAVAVVLIGLAAAGGKFVADRLETRPADGGDYVEAAVGEPHFINPLLTADNDTDRDLVSLVFSGLMRLDRDGKPVPDLAESYEVSPDGQTYTFILRKPVLWHDGTVFSSADVVATIDRIKDPAWSSPYLALFKNVKAEAPDENTVVLTLAEPYAPFLSALTVGIVPEHRWQDIPPEAAGRAEINIKPVGTGPYRFKSLIKDRRGVIRSYSLARNENYYGRKPHLLTVTFSVYQSYTEAAEALLDKKVDGVSYLPPEFRDKTEGSRSVHLYPWRLAETVAVFFNPNRSHVLRSKTVRQALNLAAERDAIMQNAAPPGSLPAYGPIPAGLTGFHPGVKKYSFDRTAAETLLEQDGWKTDADGIRKKDVKNAAGQTEKMPLALTLTVPDSKDMRETASRLEISWRAVGVQVQIEIAALGDIRNDVIRPRDYDALLYGELLGPEPDIFPFWHSSQISSPGLNLAGLMNRRADELLEKARVTMSRDDRAAYYREAQEIIADESLAVFLYNPTYTQAVSRRVHGIDAGILFAPAGRFADIANWYMKVERGWK